MLYLGRQILKVKEESVIVPFCVPSAAVSLTSLAEG